MPTLINCRTPVVAGSRKQVQMLPTCYEAWDVDDVLVQIPTGSAMVLGYLANIWNKLCAPWQAPDKRTFLAAGGDGFIDVGGLMSGDQCSYATISITTLPDNIDMVFGQEPLIYPGVCGFGATQFTEGFVETSLGSFSLGVVSQEPTFGRMRYINRRNSIWFPDHPVENVFWWKLKDGVVADITAYGTSIGNGFTASDGLINFHWNPMAGGWDTWDDEPTVLQYLQDGCGVNIPNPRYNPSFHGRYDFPGG